MSTTPHISRLIALDVKGEKLNIFLKIKEMYSDPQTTLLGGPEMYLDTRSMVNLTCVISWTVSSPHTVIWYHNHTKITFRGPRTGVSILVDKSEVTTVSLLLQTATVDDSGLYECRPDNAPRASIIIHVIQGVNLETLISLI